MCDYQGNEFGATEYPDSVCVNGYLYDADSWDGEGYCSPAPDEEKIPCPKCKEEHRRQSIIMNGKQCKYSNSDHVFNCHCNECRDNIKGYLGKEVGKVYLYTGIFAPAFLQGKKITVEHFSTDEFEKTSSCECLIKLLGGEGGQISWIPREEIYHNLIAI